MIANDFPGTSLSLELLAVLGDVLIKGTVIMFAAGLITAAMRKTSAAARHLVWAIALCGVLVLPMLSAEVPTLRLPILPRITAVAPVNLPALRLRSLSVHATAVRPLPVGTVGVAADRHAMPRLRKTAGVVAAPQSAAVVAPHRDTTAVAPAAKTGGLAAMTWHRMANHWPVLLLAIWGIGVIAIGLAGLIGHLSVARRLARARTISTGPIAQLAGEICHELKLRRPTRIALDENLRIPLAHGVFRPCVLLPTAAESWPREKLRTVLLHEFAHVARWDCASLFCGLIACILHWPDPLVWWGWRSLRSECERACDDAVLRCATAPTDYAENLLAIARSLHSAALSPPLPATLAMARPSELKGRIAAILDDRKNRRPIGVRLAVGMLIGGTLVVASCAALHLQASPPLPSSHPGNTRAAATAPARKTMTLTVIDKQTGKPLAWVKVILWNGSMLRTSVRGIVDIPLLKASPTSILNLQIEKPSYVPMELSWNSQNSAATRIPARYTVKMWRGKTISGRVDDDLGNPIAGAHVQVWWDTGPQTPSLERIDAYPISTVTDAQGFWHCAGVPVGRLKGISLGVWDYNYVWGSLHQTGAFSGYVPLRKFKDLRTFLNGRAVYTLQRGVMVHGVVRGRDGKPVAGAKVVLGMDRIATNVPSPLVTDKLGRFAFAVKPYRLVFVTATAKGYGPRLIRFNAGQKPSKLLINLPAPRLLTGKVVGPSGRPIPGALVYPDRWRDCRTLMHTMRSDYQGRFLWNDAPGGQIFVNAQAPGYAYAMDIPIHAGSKNRVVLRYQVTVHGTVVDAGTGKPINKFRVIGGFGSAPASPGGAPQVFWNTRSPQNVVGDGHFVYRPFGQFPMYEIRIEANGYGPADSKLFNSNVRNVYLHFKLRPARTITAAILNPDGAPAAGAKALLVPAGQGATIGFRPFALPQGNISRVADHHGLLSFPPQASNFQVAIRDHDGYAVVTRAGFSRSKVVRLLPWGHVHGRLLFGSETAPGQTVVVDSPAGKYLPVFQGILWSRLIKTNSKGEFVCKQLPAGETSVRLIIWEPGSGMTAFTHGGNLNDTIRVQAGKTSDVTLGGKGRCVTGRVIIPSAFARRRHWHFGVAQAGIKGPPLPFPKDVRASTNAVQNRWMRTFLKTPAGKTWISNDDRWAKTHGEFYFFIVKPDGHFLIPDVVPGKYRVYVTVLDGRKPTPMMASPMIPPLAVAKATFTMPPIPGGVTDVPLKIPPLKLVRVKTAKPADPPVPAPKRVPAVKTVPAMDIMAAPPAQGRKTMELTVIDKQTGKPLAGVKVDSQVDFGGGTETVTDAHGRANVALPRARSAWLQIFLKARHYVWQQLIWGSHNGNPTQIPSSFTVAMPRGTRISGRVVDDAGHPIAGAHVMLWINAKAEAPHEKPFVVPINLRTNRDGAWHYDGIPATGVKNIGVGVWDYQYVRNTNNFMPFVSNLTKLRNGTAISVLQRGEMVKGLVVGQNNAPIAGARVVIGSDIWGSNTPPAMTTDAKGQFAFAAKPGKRVVVTAISKGCSPMLLKFIMGSRPREIALKLPRPQILVGRVVNPVGQPLAGATVLIDTWRGCRTIMHQMNTDSRGRFTWYSAPAGKLLVEVLDNNYASRMRAPVQANSHDNVVTLHYAVRVNGTVVDALTSKPVDKFTIIRGCVFASTAANVPGGMQISWDRMYPKKITGDGHFIYTLPTQRAGYALRIAAPGYRPAVSRLFHNNKPTVHLVFRLTVAPEITANVLNPNGSPAAGAKAILIPAGQNATIHLTTWNQTQGDSTTRTRADGRMNFEPQRGNYQIVVYDKSGSAVLSRSQMPKSGTIHLTKWGHIQGLLLFGTKPGANKKILAYCDIRLDSKPGASYSGVSWWVTARTDSGGRFKISRFPAGKASVQMRISGPMAGESGALGCPVTVPPGTTVKVTLGGVGRTVEGRIAVPQSLAAFRGWYFEMADAETKPLTWPIPASVKHGTDAQQSQWFNKFFATAAGKAFFARYQLWRRTQLHDYPFVINANNTFTIHDVVPGTYVVTAIAANPAVTVPMQFGSTDQTIGTVDGTFTVPPLPGGVTDVPLKIPPLKLVPVKSANP